jgi:hypothetical protein
LGLDGIRPAAEVFDPDVRILPHTRTYPPVINVDNPAEVFDPRRVKIEPGAAAVGGTKRCVHCNRRLKRTKRKKISN